MDRKSHWEGVYRAKGAEEVSWFQPHATVSLDLIRSAATPRDAHILDVGGGASRLVDGLVAGGYRRVTVFDLAHEALVGARQRVGEAGPGVSWVEGDVLAAPFAAGSVSLWHDRAVFHFLTDPEDRARYVSEVRRIVRPDGLVLVATFAADGPTHCSGLEVARYGADDLHSVFGAGFDLIAAQRELHYTPSGAAQPFTYCLCRHVSETPAQTAA